jgi:hypothetical protein
MNIAANDRTLDCYDIMANLQGRHVEANSEARLRQPMLTVASL